MTLQPLVRSLKVEGVGTPGQHYARSSFFAVGFFVVTAFIFAVIIHALGVGLNCPGGPPGGSLAVAAVEGHRRCRVVLRVAGARRDDLWPFFGRDGGWLRRLRHALHQSTAVGCWLNHTNGKLRGDDLAFCERLRSEGVDSLGEARGHDLMGCFR